MALLTYPLTLEQFFLKLPISRSKFDLPEALVVSRTEGGDLITADQGPRLWTGQIDLVTMQHDEAPPIRALINNLRGAGKTFLVSDLTRPWPRFDPYGLLLTGAVPIISSIGATMREITISGLPAGYPLMAGDLLSFVTGTRYALHELVADAIASLAGVAGPVEVNPPIRLGAAPGAAVQLVYPRCKARLVPASSETGSTSNTVTTGVQFGWLQQLGGP